MEIVAALLIACSNLIQPSNSAPSSEVIEIKKACIARVKTCALRVPYYTNGEALEFCSGKVY